MPCDPKSIFSRINHRRVSFWFGCLAIAPLYACGMENRSTIAATEDAISPRHHEPVSESGMTSAEQPVRAELGPAFDISDRSLFTLVLGAGYSEFDSFSGPGFHDRDVLWCMLEDPLGQIRMEKLPIRISKSFDVRFDDEMDSEAISGRDITVNSTDTVIAIIGGALRTTSGPIEVYRVDREFFEPYEWNNEPFSDTRSEFVPWNDHRVELSLVREPTSRAGPGDYVFRLRVGELKQTLLVLSGDRLNDPGLLCRWIADFDRDGRPDILVTAWEHYAAGTTYLFLSGHAKPGGIVGCAAIVHHAGC